MKYLFYITIIFSGLFIGCKDDAGAINNNKQPQAYAKSKDNDLSIKEIDSITANENFKFSKKNLQSDSTTRKDSIKASKTKVKVK